MPVGLGKTEGLITLIGRNFWILGLLPADRSDLVFYFYFIYLAIHINLSFVDFIENFGNLKIAVANLTENVILSMTLLKIATFRIYKKKLCSYLDVIEEDLVEENDKIEEKVVFIKYMSMARIYIGISMRLTTITVVLYYLRPISGQLGAILYGNTSITYELPYRVHLFFEVTKKSTYILSYVFQVPIVPIVIVGFTGMDGLVVTLMLYVCGQLAVLAHRVTVMQTDPRGFHNAIRSFVERHLDLMRMATSLNDSLNPLLLGQVIGLSVLVAVNGFNIIVNSSTIQAADLYVFLLYGFASVLTLYIYCFIGECLIHESMHLQDVFYGCSEWHKMPPANARMILICMVQAQKPLVLSAAKCFIFSHTSFTDVMRTSMAYISLLRNFV